MNTAAADAVDGDDRGDNSYCAKAEAKADADADAGVDERECVRI